MGAGRWAHAARPLLCLFGNRVAAEIHEVVVQCLDKSTRGSYCFDVLVVRRDARKQHLETGEASSGIRLLE